MFIGNLPFDVKVFSNNLGIEPEVYGILIGCLYNCSVFSFLMDYNIQDEELYQIFTPELDVEAIRVVRDPHTSLSKGIAFVLFKTKVNRVNFT